MNNSYGPWATSIDGGGSPQLSTFWRRRLTRLMPTSRTSPVLSRRSLAWLLAAGALVLVLPTFRAEPAAAAGEEKRSERRKTVVTVVIESDVPGDEDSEKESAKDSSKPSEKTTGKSAEARRPRHAVVSEWTLPDGTKMLSTTVTSHEDGQPAHLGEIKKLIAKKEYKPLKTFESPDGRTQYVYQFTLADGGHTAMNFSMPLEDVTSWEDYQEKQKKQEEQRREKINQAIAAGRFRLINVGVLQVHLCRDVESGQVFKIQRIAQPDGKDIAFPRQDGAGAPPSVKRGTWQEHLQAIRDGRRELLGMETVNDYTYEMTSDDGAKLLFTYGGDKPLKEPDEREE